MYHVNFSKRQGIHGRGVNPLEKHLAKPVHYQHKKSESVSIFKVDHALKLSDDLSIANISEPLTSRGIDVLTDEVYGTISEQEMGPPGV